MDGKTRPGPDPVPGPAPACITPRRILFLTLEYKAGTFSGNGIYSQSMVRSLSRLGHSVLVISAAPHEVPGIPAAGAASASPGACTESGLIQIPVPVWGRLDWECSWQDFAAGITPAVAAEAAAFRPDWALVVDWSALGAYQALGQHGAQWEHAGWSLPPMTYLNYRVYTLSEYKGARAQEEKAFYREKEGQAVAQSWAVTALSSRDAKFLLDELGDGRPTGAPPAQALLPPLREDMRQIALGRKQQGEWVQRRKFLSCCVRLSPEKNADLFSALVEQLAPFLAASGIVPLLCAGASSGDPYAQGIKERVRRAAPGALVLEGFQGPDKMGELYAQTLLNIHPCLYDAYGMTMVEAAAFGAPSVVNVGPGGAVGASELLDPTQGLAFAVDLTQHPTVVAERLQGLLGDVEGLGAVGEAAARKSLSWSEEANARELTRIVEQSSSHETSK